MKWEKLLETYVVGENCCTACELYRAIDEELPKYYEVLMKISVECWA